MKILHISTFDTGGAAKSCIRLHSGLLEKGVDSKLLLLEKTDSSLAETYQHDILLQEPKQIAKSKIRRILHEFKLHNGKSKYDDVKSVTQQTTACDLFSSAETMHRIHLNQYCRDADIINIHWAAGFLDYPSFFNNINKPIVWTLHDMHAFSGGCHYSNNCILFANSCSNCPLFSSEKGILFVKNNFLSKKKALSHFENTTIVSPSNWLMQLSTKSRLFQNYSHHHIPYGLNETIFTPRNKQFAREVLNLSSSKIILLFVAEDINNKRKGMHILLEAIKGIADKTKYQICTIGKGETHLDGFDCKNLGTIHDEQLMSIAYSAADVFIIPSLEDNLPNTVLESLMCGTPVIGFNNGGIAEMLNTDNGILVDNSNALKSAIETFTEKLSKFNRENISANAKQKYSSHIQTQKYIDLYKNIL